VTEQLGPYTLTLDSCCFPLGSDSLSLGDFATVRSGWRVCDLGCGGGTLLLLLARRTSSLSLTGVEIDENSAQCARRNLSANGLVGEILAADLRQRALLPNEGFDLVISNPPYFSAGAGGGPARSEEHCSFDELCTSANRLLKTGGRFALVHRPERLADLLCTLRAHKLEPKRLQFVTFAPDRPPSALLIEAVKNGGVGVQILPPRITHEPKG